MFTFSGLLPQFPGGAPKKGPNFTGVAPQQNASMPLAKPSLGDNFADFQAWAAKKSFNLNQPDIPFTASKSWFA